MTGSTRGMAWLYGSVFVAGAAVMVVEILGSRLLAPYYGTGIQVWSALISVTLLALSLGYWAGGRLADARASRAFLAWLLGGAAPFVYLLPRLSDPVLAATEGLGPRWGVLAGSLALFGAPLALLGMVTPCAVRLHPRVLEAVGRSAGSLYAVSTLGSIAGALLVGFWLIGSVGVARTFQLTAAALAAAAAAGFWRSEGRGRGLAGAVALAAAAAWALSAPSAPLELPEGVRIVGEAESFYARLTVLDTPQERCLLMSNALHTHVRRNLPADPVQCEYIRTFDLLPALRPAARSCLVIGMGGGSILKTFGPLGLSLDVVEIDGKVPDLAQRHFGPFRFRGAIHVSDGRAFVRRALPLGPCYDLAVLDVVSADAMPEHLSTVEFFRELKGVLRPGAVLGMNSIGPWEGRPLPSLQRTLEAAFHHVEGFAAEASRDRGNVVFVASDGPLDLPAEISSRFRPHAVRFQKEQGVLLTDDFNPLNHDNAEASFESRKLSRRTFGTLSPR